MIKKMGKRRNKIRGKQKIDLLKSNTDKPISWLSKELERSEGSIITMLRKIKKESDCEVIITLPPASPKQKSIYIQNNSKKPLKVVSSSPIILEENESKEF